MCDLGVKNAPYLTEKHRYFTKNVGMLIYKLFFAWLARVRMMRVSFLRVSAFGHADLPLISYSIYFLEGVTS